MRRWLGGTFAFLLVWPAAAGRAEPPRWQPVEPASPPAAPGPAASLDRPDVRPPLARGQTRPAPLAQLAPPLPAESSVNLAPPAPPRGPVFRASAPDADYAAAKGPAATLGSLPDRPTVTVLTPAPLDSSPEERYNWGVVTDPLLGLGPKTNAREKPKAKEPVKEAKAENSWRHDVLSGGFWKRISEPGCEPLGGRAPFQSDHEFDYFASPVSNPFLFEDPRALTELRPIFMFQSIPNSTPFLHGGNAEFFGLQGRLALTPWLSITLNKLGGIVLNPGKDGEIGNQVGMSDIALGPKFTFWRDPQTRTVAAAGAIFQIPVGSSAVFQHTGSLSIVPYGSIAQNFFRTSWGSFNVMDTLGYSFATDSKRSDFLYNSVHLDYDVGNLQRFYPMLELNWFHYTKNGSASPLGIEGLDLANFGAAVRGHDYLNLAAGARFKLTEATQFGIAAQFPLTSPKDLMDFRVTLDFIWRY